MVKGYNMLGITASFQDLPEIQEKASMRAGGRVEWARSVGSPFAIVYR
jgi:hypothetical protein